MMGRAQPVSCGIFVYAAFASARVGREREAHTGRSKR